MSILITIGIVVCGIVLLLERRESKRLHYRGYREITGLDWWRVKKQ